MEANAKMSAKMVGLLKKIPGSYFTALGLIILAELFICNYLFFRNIGNEALYYYIQDQENDSISLNGLKLLDDGRLFVRDCDNAYIEIRDLDIDGRCLYLELSDIQWSYEDEETLGENAIDFYIEMTDESHVEFYNRGGTRTVSSLVEQTKYISLRPMGNLKSLRINLYGLEYSDVISLDYIAVNCKRPLFFSIWRVMLFFLLFLLISHLRGGSKLYEISYDVHSVLQKRVSLVALLLTLMISCHLSGYLTQGASWSDNPYDLLAHSMANGHVDLDIDMPADESLLAVDDPYVPDKRADVIYTWDCAYYEGRYYVYYGVVPEILFYLPYYLMTGNDLGVLTVGRIELFFYITGIFFCFLELGKRFSKRLPYVTWLLLFVSSVTGLQVILLSRCVLFYNIPVIMGCALIFWGIYFWITAKKEDDTYSIPKITAGSLCMALTAGCRPHMIFGSALAIPIFIRYFMNDMKEKREVKRTTAYLAAGALPYIVVLGLLFYYNAIRFGSPFEFGARYNLTAIDVMRVKADFGKVIPGVFLYLFMPPKLTAVFPFIDNDVLTTSYSGDFFSHYSNGGFMICNPLTFFVFYGMRKKGLFENVYQIGFYWSCLIVAAIILGINLMMGGFMPRYFCDFSPFIHLAFLPLLCLMIAGADDRSRRSLLPLVSVLCIITIVYHSLTYYVGDGGSYFNMYDREVFLRAACLLQWWE